MDKSKLFFKKMHCHQKTMTVPYFATSPVCTCRLEDGTHADSWREQMQARVVNKRGSPARNCLLCFTPYLLSPILPSPFGEGSGVRLFFVGPDGPIVFLCQCLTTIYCGLAIYWQALCQHADYLSLFNLKSGFNVHIRNF